MVVSFMPASATMSPANASSMSSRLFEVHQQHAADLFLLVLHRVQDLALGQLARIDAGEKVSEPTKGSFMILNASAENGASSLEGRSASSSLSGSTPLIAGTSSGDGM